MSDQLPGSSVIQDMEEAVTLIDTCSCLMCRSSVPYNYGFMMVCLLDDWSREGGNRWYHPWVGLWSHCGINTAGSRHGMHLLEWLAFWCNCLSAVAYCKPRLDPFSTTTYTCTSKQMVTAELEPQTHSDPIWSDCTCLHLHVLLN